MYFLVHVFSRSQHDVYRETVSGECIVKDDGVRSCLIELQSFLWASFMSTQYTVFWCFFTLSANTKQDAVHPSQSHPDLCVPCSLDPQTWRIPSVFCSKFVLLVAILNSWSINWLLIQCGKCTRTNRSELIHHRVMKDQWDCVLNDLEELGDKEFLLLMEQYNNEIFSCFLRLLSLYSSTFHQTNVELETSFRKFLESREFNRSFFVDTMKKVERNSAL